MRYRAHQRYYLGMVLPGMILLLIFNILPMFGITIAFQDFAPAKGLFGSKWVGLKHFERLFMRQEVRNVLCNTVIIAAWKIVLNIGVPVAFALLINEVKSVAYKRTLQTIVYLPHFLSWVILGILFTNIFSYNGLFNQMLSVFGVERQMHMIQNGSFRKIIVGTDVWKEFGYGAIIYLAAITNIDPNVYEAAKIDGANRWQSCLSITWPSIRPTVVIMLIMQCGQILNAGFDQVFNLYNDITMPVADIFDTFIYRYAFQKGQNFSLTVAAGLFKSVCNFALLLAANGIAKLCGEEGLL